MKSYCYFSKIRAFIIIRENCSDFYSVFFKMIVTTIFVMCPVLNTVLSSPKHV